MQTLDTLTERRRLRRQQMNRVVESIVATALFIAVTVAVILLG